MAHTEAAVRGWSNITVRASTLLVNSSNGRFQPQQLVPVKHSCILMHIDLPGLVKCSLNALLACATCRVGLCRVIPRNIQAFRHADKDSNSMPEAFFKALVFVLWKRVGPQRSSQRRLGFSFSQISERWFTFECFDSTAKWFPAPQLNSG